MSEITQFMLDGDVVVAISSSNVLAEGYEEVDSEIYAAAIGRVGRVRLVDGDLVDIPWTEPAQPLPTISDRQFFQALASEPYNLIAEEEAEEAVATGAIPGVMQAVIDVLPADQRFKTRMVVRGATTFERSNPLVEVFGASQDMNSDAIDDFWRFASAL